MFAGKKGIVMGVANERSMAWAISCNLCKLGADVGFSHLPDKDERKKNSTKLQKMLDNEGIAAKLVAPCNVSSDESIDEFFDKVKEIYGSIDFLVHSIAFADVEEIRKPVYQVSREGFRVGIDISAYSLLAILQRAVNKNLFNQGASVVAMTYYGAEKVVPGYNVMGICKATLESCIKYSAWDLGKLGVRVNGISAGPVKTLAASAVGVDGMRNMYSDIAPLGRNIVTEEVGKTATYLLSDMSSAVTGEIIHVDCGYNIMGAFVSPEQI